MYTWTNKEENKAWAANYAECCKHKWTIEKCVKINGKWKRTDLICENGQSNVNLLAVTKCKQI